jgi:hypothetical protein
VRVYGIFESEVTSISMMNSLATLAFSGASAFLSFAVAIWTNATFYQTLTPEAVVLSHLVAPGLCVLSVVGYGLGASALISRRGTWRAIQRESRSRTPPE